MKKSKMRFIRSRIAKSTDKCIKCKAPNKEPGYLSYNDNLKGFLCISCSLKLYYSKFDTRTCPYDGSLILGGEEGLKIHMKKAHGK